MPQAEGDEARPRFPPELEREIFERTAKTYQGTGVILALVCRRVQLWIEIIIYETVTLSSPTLCAQFLRAIDARPPAFFTAHVKSLCIPSDIGAPDAERILVVCQGVVNLAYWIPQSPPSFQIITSLRPKRLSISINGLFGKGSSALFGQPFFANVTHLELVDWPSMPLSSNLQLLPCLTHLALDVERFHDNIIERLGDILNSCQSLLVLLCLVPDDNVMVNASSLLSELDDSRLVMLSDADVLEDWEASLINSEACQWAFAEGITKEKAKLAGPDDTPSLD